MLIGSREDIQTDSEEDRQADSHGDRGADSVKDRRTDSLEDSMTGSLTRIIWSKKMCGNEKIQLQFNGNKITSAKEKNKMDY